MTDRRGEVTGRVFEFSSGGANQKGPGEWLVRLRGNAFWIANQKKTKTIDYGTFAISEKDVDRLWQFVVEARIEGRKSSQRLASRKESVYVFLIADSGRDVHSLEIWRDDAQSDKQLAKVVRYIAHLIKKYAKEEALL